MKLRVTRPRVLLLHGLTPLLHHEKSLARTLGEKSICSVSLQNSMVNVGVSLLWCALSLAVTGVSGYLTFILLRTRMYVKVIVNVSAAAVVVLLYLIAARLRFALMVARARVKAQQVFNIFRPNMIVACSYGAAVALTLEIPMLPLILFTPAQDRFAEYLCDTPVYYSLHRFPYVLICHGVSDVKVPFEDTIRLANTIPEERCYLVSLDSDDHELRDVITDDEMRDIVLFTYREGWINAFGLTPRELRQNNCILDASLLPLKDLVSFASIALNRRREVAHIDQHDFKADTTEKHFSGQDALHIV